MRMEKVIEKRDALVKRVDKLIAEKKKVIESVDVGDLSAIEMNMAFRCGWCKKNHSNKDNHLASSCISKMNREVEQVEKVFISDEKLIRYVNFKDEVKAEEIIEKWKDVLEEFKKHPDREIILISNPYWKNFHNKTMSMCNMIETIIILETVLLPNLKEERRNKLSTLIQVGGRWYTQLEVVRSIFHNNYLLPGDAMLRPDHVLLYLDVDNNRVLLKEHDYVFLVANGEIKRVKCVLSLAGIEDMTIEEAEKLEEIILEGE